jgi:hypothetical protein
VTSSDPGAIYSTPTSTVFRISPLNLLAIVALSVCAVPAAFGAPWFWVIYIVPLALAIRVLRIRTTAGPDGLAARGVLRATRVAWEDVSALRLRSSRIRSRVSAVLRTGSELPLPAVHVRDLPRLAAASGGRLPDPTGTDPTAAEPEPTSPPEPPEE